MNDQANIAKTKRSRRFSPFLLIRLLGVGLFIYILATVDISALWMNMKEVDVYYLLLAIVFQIMLLFIKALRWHILNDGSREQNRIFRSFGEFFESYAIGVITPGRLGELVKAGHAKEKNRILETGIRVVVERGFDLGIFVIIAGLALLFTFNDTATNILGLLALLGGLFVMILAFIFMGSAKATHLVQVFLNRLPFFSLKLDLSFRKRTINIQAFIFLLSVISNLSYFVSCFFLAAGLSFEPSFLYISGAVAIAGLLNMLPITVMGLGTREGSFLLLFKPLAEPLILAFSGLVFLVAQIGGGVIAFILGYFFLLLSSKK